ncbi:hypothetical protein OTU49_008578 [Cherax quadricarinatus]|uniref:Ubiquitin-like domain-containing protein n=1 Tax=Cherax quadricarinatus TaxID=27406 RepID=A0AAW0Y7Y0_CHEQU
MKSITVKWNGKEYDIEVDESVMTVKDFKDAIEKQTCVRPHRQKLLNLKLKGKTPDDDTKMGAISLRPGTKVHIPLSEILKFKKFREPKFFLGVWSVSHLYIIPTPQHGGMTQH